MNKPTLSVEELKLILAEMLNMQYCTNQRMQDYIRKALGGEIQEEDPLGSKLISMLMDTSSLVIAKRLMRNRCNVRMISEKDLAMLIPLIVEQFEKKEGFEFDDDEERKLFGKSIKTVFKELLSSGQDIQWSYEEYWRRVSVIVEVSRNEGVYYPELFSCEEYVDEVMRGWLSREEFIISYGKVMSALSDIKEVVRIFTLPTLESLNITDVRKRLKAKRELEEKLTPILAEHVRRINDILPHWISDEVARIYKSSEEYDCTQCAQSSILREIPGQFRDFDADEIHGTCGIPLCSKCIGTGRRIEAAEFLALSKEVSKLRSSNSGIQYNAAGNKNWRIQVEANNELLVELARKALEIVRQPVRNCLAIKLINGEL